MYFKSQVQWYYSIPVLIKAFINILNIVKTTDVIVWPNINHQNIFAKEALYPL